MKNILDFGPSRAGIYRRLAYEAAQKTRHKTFMMRQKRNKKRESTFLFNLHVFKHAIKVKQHTEETEDKLK
jgi:hypothetical protein